MPVLKVYPRGVTGGYVGEPPKGSAPRGRVAGWSADSLGRNTRWLYGVLADELPSEGVAATLTLRDCPPSPDDWRKLREALWQRLRRRDLVLLHWVVEWQRRGVPHLHLAVWLAGLTATQTAEAVAWHWLAVAARYGAAPAAQHVEPMRSADCWGRYVAKHADRGVRHYQRDPSLRPAGWAESGRMWGHCGDWPTGQPIKLELEPEHFERVRHALYTEQADDAERRGDCDRARYLRRRLEQGIQDPADIGLTEWADAVTVLRLVDSTAGEGERPALPRRRDEAAPDARPERRS